MQTKDDQNKRLNNGKIFHRKFLIQKTHKKRATR